MVCLDDLGKRVSKVSEDILGREVCLAMLKRVHLALLVLLVRSVKKEEMACLAGQD